MPVADHFRNDEAKKLIEKLSAEAEKMGLYVQAAGIMSPPSEDEDQDPPVILQVAFLVGERAFAPGNLETDPLKVEEEKTFADLIQRAQDPTVEVRDEIKKGLDGGGILDLDDDVDDIIG